MSFLPSRSSTRRLALYVALSAVFTLWLIWPRYPQRVPDQTYGLLKQTTPSSPYAIATFLTEDTYGTPDDFYFIATRILTYQLLHANETRCRRPIPFLVLITDAVTQDKRDQLTKDGAEVVLVQDVPLNWWIRTGVTRWKDQFTKLRLLEMTQYERVLFIDADTLLTGPVDGIFDDSQSTSPSNTLFERREAVRRDEEQLPAQYVFAARSDNDLTGQRDHPFPPLHTEVFSAGFWLAAPSQELFKYLISVMSHYRRFNPRTMEQSLLNYAFREDGAMPWQELDYRWSATWPSMKDLEGGVATLHEKFWRTGPDELRSLWWEWKEKMEAYYTHGV
jgi:alpha-N-acetylglucosamine transferase